MKVDYCYIIHRTKDTNRDNIVKDLMKKTPTTCFEIVDEDSKLWYTPTDKDLLTFICFWSKKIKLPVISHYHNMMNIHKDIVKNKYNNVMIYEDDVKITNFDFNLFDIDNSKMFYNLDTDVNIGYVIGDYKSRLTRETFDINNPKHKYRFCQTGAIFLPTFEKTQELVEIMEADRIRKKGKFRVFDIERCNALRRVNKLNECEFVIESVTNGFNQDKNLGSILGNPVKVIKEFL